MRVPVLFLKEYKTDYLKCRASFKCLMQRHCPYFLRVKSRQIKVPYAVIAYQLIRQELLHTEVSVTTCSS